jgi:hypothetical protein
LPVSAFGALNHGTILKTAHDIAVMPMEEKTQRIEVHLEASILKILDGWRRLIKGPQEFRDVRTDLPKSKS